MQVNVAKEVAALPRMTVQELRAKHVEAFGEDTNTKNKAWLVKRIAWRLQALAEGAVVLCDRYTDSSEAYQGAGRGLGSERILEMHRVVCNNVQPELTILLLPPLAASLKRARRRNDRHVQQAGTDENRFEREGDEFYTRVYEQYREIARRDQSRVSVFDEEGSIAAIHERILEVVRQRLASTAGGVEASGVPSPLAE